MGAVATATEGRWLTPTQASHVLGVSAQRVRQLMESGRLVHVTTPLGRLVDQRSVHELALERGGGPKPPGAA